MTGGSVGKEVPQAGRNQIPGEPVVLRKLPLLFGPQFPHLKRMGWGRTR